MHTRATALLLFMFISLNMKAQDGDMMNLLGKDSAGKEYVFNAFKSSRVIMSHSMEMLRAGILDFRILHRFGAVSQGASEFFGLDQATIRLGLDYAITDNITVGIGRGSYKKELDGFIKYRPIQQATGPGAAPVSVVLAAGTTLTTAPWSDPSRENFFSSRLAYYGQVIIGRKFSDVITLQLIPTLLHRNLVPTTADPNNLIAIGAGGRLKLSKRISFNVDYYYPVNQNSLAGSKNPLSLGFDIETGGHVFQLHFTNASGMNERAFLVDTYNDFFKGEIAFGFNISRAFQLKKKKI